MPNINFYSQETEYELPNKRKIRSWIINVLQIHQKNPLDLNFIFTSDRYLFELNQKFLNHNTYTDIITFDYSESNDDIKGDVFISIDRIKENSEIFEQSFIDELHRVMIHGVLHLLGLKDKTTTEKEEMRKFENHYLALRL